MSAILATLRLAGLGLVLAACAHPEPSGPDGDDATVRGTVASVDLSPMAYDGDGLVTVETAEGTTTVRVPARTNLCRATGLDAVGALRPGDRVLVVGARDEDGAVTPCLSPDHRLSRLGASGSTP